jgi:golgi SNAP receptor complex member 1
MLRAIQRHRDVYQDYVKEFRRTKVCTAVSIHHHSLEPHPLSLSGTFQANVQAAVDQANLLSGVRNDIEFVFSSQLLRTRSVC